MQLRLSARGMALAMAGLFGAIVLAADLGLPLPWRRALALPLVDKLGHFCLFGFLSWLVVRAALETRPRWPHALVGTACSALLVTLAAAEEFSQRYISTRTYSLWDFAASAGGILVMSALQVWAHSRTARSAQARITDTRV